MQSHRRRLFSVGFLAATLALCAVAIACNVPVFRFALERWRPDPYRVVLLHKGPLTAADLEILRPLEDQQDQALANLSFRTVDVNDLAKADDKADDEIDEQLTADRELLAAQGDAPLPRLIVQYPLALRILKPVWAGAPERAAIAGLIDSPIRQELIKRLADGQTAVWLLLEPSATPARSASEGDPAALLAAELPKLQQELKLPELTTAPEDALLANTPLRVEFSLLRVRRDDPAEQALVAMLIHSEPDLAERNDPMVFPVFGRGRALLPLIGAGITAKNIYDSASFLVGPCSCEVKELNPGFDLLLSTDWEERLATDGVPLATPPPAVAPTGPPVLLAIPAGAAPTTVTYPAPVVVQTSYMQTALVSRKLWVIGGAGIAGLLMIAAVVAIAQTRGQARS